jgi:hypothetical protein
LPNGDAGGLLHILQIISEARSTGRLGSPLRGERCDAEGNAFRNRIGPVPRRAGLGELVQVLDF